ncbi:MAG: hypothetical protein ACYTF1_14235 [Planctomycetota bacterium]
MDMRSPEQAMDCVGGFMDWTAIGARILQTAAKASAIHLHQNAEAGHEAALVDALDSPDHMINCERKRG